MINLFAVPPQPAPSSDGASAVVSAIREGSGTSGADFDYLLKTAGRESSFDPKAKAENSSATGLFQFIDQTWLRMVKSYGPSVGLGVQSRMIVEDRPGHFDLADRDQRAAVLNLRHDPKLASALAGFLTRENAADLSSSLGRKVSLEELYIAHVLGASGAADLIKLSGSDPDRPASPLFAEAARANPTLFYDRAKAQLKTLAEVRNGLADAYRNASSEFAAIAAVDDDNVDVPVEIKPDQTKTLYSLFQNRSEVVPLNPYVRDMWQASEAQDAPDPLLQPSYFPRSAASLVTYNANALPPLPDARANVPLPPKRPNAFSTP